MATEEDLKMSNKKKEIRRKLKEEAEKLKKIKLETEKAK